MSKKTKRFLSLLMTLAMVFSTALAGYSPLKAVAADTVYSDVFEYTAETQDATDYGLMDTVQEGVILHAWQWSFNNIKANMQTIAESGYTAVQTSVIQQAKEGTKGKTNEVWWVYYQPANFTIDNTGNSALGTKAEFAAMCAEAHKYGVKVIVDVVANHLGNNRGYDLASTIPDDIRNDSNCWHDKWNQEIDYGSRYSITHGSMGGLPDLNSENTKIQTYVKNYLRECIDAGADGFRFDAAKHIGVPNDTEGSNSDFWPNVLSDANSYYEQKGYFDSLYCYGEILYNTGGPAISEYTKYMSVTDSETGNGIRNCVNGGNAQGAATSYYNLGAGASKTVLWAESHDTYSNDSKESTNVSDANINKTWALVGSRNGATALYFARTAGYRGGNIGDICSRQCFNKEVVEVNKFHNYFNGQSEYNASSGSIAYIERGTSGVVLVNVSGGSTSVNVTANKMAAGTYTDQVSGNTFTVANGKITGQIGNTGIAVVYNAGPIVTTPVATISQEGGNFSSDTLSLTIGLKNATSGTYKIGSGSATTFTGSKTITIGSGMNAGDSVTVTLTATDGSTDYSKSYTFKKVEKTNNVAWLALPSGWSNPKCYIYDKVTEVNNAEWPGVAMTKDTDSGYYYCEVPENITTPMVIFYSSDSNRYPAAMESGLALTGSMIYRNGSWEAYDGGGGGDDIVLPDVPSGHTRIFFKNAGSWSTVNYYNWITGSNTSVAQWPGSAMAVADSANGIYYADVNTSGGYNSIIFNNGSAKTDDLTVPTDGKNMFTWGGSWSTYTPATTEKGKVIVKYVDASGNSIATSETLTGKVGDSYTTTAKTISGYTLNTTPSNATGKYTKADITVTYTYKAATSGPSVTASLADGSSFKTERTNVTLTLSNADSGTYTVDNGITKTFTGSKTIEIGEGKIGDSNITVKVTATKGSTTNTQTFTYKKVFNGTVNEVTGNAATLSNTSLDSQYQTGTSTTSKTITVDGDISDWTSAMLIAQGAANDDPRVYRENSMHEVPIDLYALYATYDNSNLYLMWEMTNVQDVVANYDGLDYPLSQGILYETQDLPFFIAIDTKKSSDKIGNDCKSSAGATIWDSGLTFKQNVTRIIATNTKATKAFVYGGDSSGLNTVELYNLATSGITMKYGKGILSTSVKGINAAFGSNGGRVVGDMTSGASYVDFVSLGHNSSKYDFHYEMSIPFSTLGVTASEVQSNGLGVQLFATFGTSAMDCLPYDVAMNDNADQPDTKSQPDNSFEKSDADCITVPMGYIVKGGGSIVVIDDPTPSTELVLNFGADRSAPQATGTALSLLGKASGGSGTYSKYQYYVNGSLIATKTAETAVTWTPSSAGKYTIMCVVTDSAGNKVTSAKYFTVEGTTAETKPTISSITAGDKTITVKWGAITGATNYRVFTYLNSKYSKVGETTGTTYTISGLTNGTKYGVYVLAYVGGTWAASDTSHIKYATPTASTTTNTKPVISSLTAGDKQIKATWGAISGATKYRVFTYLNSKYTKVAEITGTTYTITGLTNGTKYGVYVLAYVNGAWAASDTSHIKYATPAASTTTNYKPVISSLTAGNRGIIAKWGAVSGASNYRVFTYLNSSYTKVGETTGTSFNIIGLTNGTRYGVYVLACVNGSWVASDTSHIKYATPAADNKPIVNCTAGNAKITAKWTAVNGAAGYRVFTYVNGKYTKVKDTTATSYTITGLANGINYGVYVLAYVNGSWVASDTNHIAYAKPTA